MAATVCAVVVAVTAMVVGTVVVPVSGAVPIQVSLAIPTVVTNSPIAATGRFRLADMASAVIRRTMKGLRPFGVAGVSVA
jgi:hypothetical protein